MRTESTDLGLSTTSMIQLERRLYLLTWGVGLTTPARRGGLRLPHLLYGPGFSFHNQLSDLELGQVPQPQPCLHSPS